MWVGNLHGLTRKFWPCKCEDAKKCKTICKAHSGRICVGIFSKEKPVEHVNNCVKNLLQEGQAFEWKPMLEYANEKTESVRDGYNINMHIGIDRAIHPDKPLASFSFGEHEFIVSGQRLYCSVKTPLNELKITHNANGTPNANEHLPVGKFFLFAYGQSV